MMWQRITCDKERNDSPGAKGTLILGDALTCDLSAWMEKAQCVYLDPPYFTGERFTMRMRIGEMGWQAGSRYIDLPAYNDFAGLGGDEYIASCARLFIWQNRS